MSVVIEWKDRDKLVIQQLYFIEIRQMISLNN